MSKSRFHRIAGAVIFGATLLLARAASAQTNPQLPPLCATITITTFPLQGASTTRDNRYCRDRYGRTRFENGRFYTINDPIGRSTTVLDTASQTYTVTAWDSYNAGDGPYDYTARADMATATSPPPPRPTPGCPTGNEGWSVSAATGNLASSQDLVNMWPCPSMALPMYV